VASEELDLYAGNERPGSSFLATPPNFADSDRDQASNQCRCVSDDFSESTTCPTHTSLSSEHTRRMRREALGELQVYRNLKEHLKNLKGVFHIYFPFPSCFLTYFFLLNCRLCFSVGTNLEIPRSENVNRSFEN
jgi:hypothetical protein